MPSRPLVLATLALVLVAALATWLLAPRLLPGLRPAPPATQCTLPSLDGIPGWTGEAVAGGTLERRPVVLLLWSDTDPRSLAALAVVDAWSRAYAPLGVSVIAVHEPEYAFAADTLVAVRAAARLGVTLPLAFDPTGLAASRAGGATNEPHVFVADEHGVVVLDTVGTLGPAQERLRAIVARLHPGTPLPPEVKADLPAGVRVVALGAGRATAGPLVGVAPGVEQVFTAPLQYEEQGSAWTPYPVGGWRTSAEGLTATRGGAANFVAIRYSAGRVGVVASPPPGGSARLWILRDEEWPRPQDRGDDVVVEGREAAYVQVTEPRVYWIDRGQGERVLKLSPDPAGVTLHAFVFTDAPQGRAGLESGVARLPR